MRVLGNLRAAEARPELREAMLDEGLTDVRAQATRALGKIADPEDVPTDGCGRRGMARARTDGQRSGHDRDASTILSQYRCRVRRYRGTMDLRSSSVHFRTEKNSSNPRYTPATLSSCAEPRSSSPRQGRHASRIAHWLQCAFQTSHDAIHDFDTRASSSGGPIPAPLEPRDAFDEESAEALSGLHIGLRGIRPRKQLVDAFDGGRGRLRGGAHVSRSPGDHPG